MVLAFGCQLPFAYFLSKSQITHLRSSTAIACGGGSKATVGEAGKSPGKYYLVGELEFEI
jgi:hypothetical protein